MMNEGIRQAVAFMTAAVIAPSASAFAQPIVQMDSGESSPYLNGQLNNAGADICQDKGFQRLQEIQNLKDDWDEEGSPAIPIDVINRMRLILPMLSVSPAIYPTGRQSLQFQYEKEDQSYLEFEIFTDYIDMLYVPKGVIAQAVEKRLGENGWLQVGGLVTQFFEVG